MAQNVSLLDDSAIMKQTRQLHFVSYRVGWGVKIFSFLMWISEFRKFKKGRFNFIFDGGRRNGGRVGMVDDCCQIYNYILLERRQS